MLLGCGYSISIRIFYIKVVDCSYTHYVVGILMNVSGKLVYKQWNKKVKTIDCSYYTSFKYLALDENDTAYAIAAGPTKSSSVIKIQLDTEQVSVLRNTTALLHSVDDVQLFSHDFSFYIMRYLMALFSSVIFLNIL